MKEVTALTMDLSVAKDGEVGVHGHEHEDEVQPLLCSVRQRYIQHREPFIIIILFYSLLFVFLFVLFVVNVGECKE